MDSNSKNFNKLYKSITEGKFSEEELIRDWTLSAQDKSLLSKFRKNNRQNIAIQICAVRLYGQLLNNYGDLSPRIINYINKQLELPPTLYATIPTREATYLEHRKHVLNYLGFKTFNDDVKRKLEKWIINQIHKGIPLTDELLPKAEQFLFSEKIILPGATRLRRLINSICSQHQQDIFDKTYAKLTPKLRQSIDSLLVLKRSGDKSQFSVLKEYPPAATITALQTYIKRYHLLEEMGLDEIDISHLETEFQKYLFKSGKYYDASDIKRFRVQKQYTIMVAFLHETRRIILDYVLEMHEQYISNICREVKNAYEGKHREYRKKYDSAIHNMATAVDIILNADTNVPIYPNDIYKKVGGKKKLQESREDIKICQRFSKYGYANLLVNRYNSMRKYFAEFIKLPFAAQKGSENLLDAIYIIRKLDNGEFKKLPAKLPTTFIDKRLIKGLHNKDGQIKRSIWELGVAIAMKDALKSRDLYIPESKKYVSFWDLIYSEPRWLKERPQAYEILKLKEDPYEAAADLRDKFHKTAILAKKNFALDNFSSIQNNKLKLRKSDKLEESDEVKRLHKVLKSSLPKIRIEQLLLEVDQVTKFSRHFTPIHGQKSLPKHFYKTLLASIISQATNIGVAAMHDCTTNITIDMMRHVIRTCIREETIKNANTEIVNHHAQLPLSLIHGSGELSSSDGQRFGISASSLLASFYPRYFGYYEKAIGVYTHVSDQYSVFGTKVISCSPREALFVLDALLENDTILKIREHTTDTAGYTEHIFALCFLLGFYFMPRIKDLKDQQLYRIDRNTDYGELDTLLTKTASIDLVTEQWDQMVRITASLKNRLAPANEIIRRLIKGSPSDRLSKAFTNLGRIIKTDYILRYITDSELRHRVQRQLNKGEHRHGLSRWMFFANQGEFQTGDYEEIMNKASCLSLVSNAVLYWNTIHIAKIIDQLRAQGEYVSDEALSHISLLLYKHVIPMGTYFVNNPGLFEAAFMPKPTVWMPN